MCTYPVHKRTLPRTLSPCEHMQCVLGLATPTTLTSSPRQERTGWFYLAENQHLPDLGPFVVDVQFLLYLLCGQRAVSTALPMQGHPSCQPPDEVNEIHTQDVLECCMLMVLRTDRPHIRALASPQGTQAPVAGPRVRGVPGICLDAELERTLT